MEFNIDELTALVLQHSRAAMQARKTAEELQKYADREDGLTQIYLEASKRIIREKEEKESKMTIRKLITGVSVLVLLFCLVGVDAQPRALAQDVPPAAEVTATVPATINGQPVEATLEPTAPAPVDQTSSVLSVVFDKVGNFILIIAVVVLAFKTGSLIPADTVDKVIARGFELAMGLADTTSTPVDNQFLTIGEPIVRKWVADELAKQQSLVSVSMGIQVPPGTTPADVQNALQQAPTNLPPGGPIPV